MPGRLKRAGPRTPVKPGGTFTIPYLRGQGSSLKHAQIMKNRLHLRGLLSLALAGTLLTGCTDGIFSDTEALSDSQDQIASFSKLRHQHLLRAKFLSRTKVLERYSELAASDDFVLGMSKVLERYRVLERYESYEGVAIKRQFKKALNGFAVHLDDTKISVHDFLAIVEGDADIEWIEPDIKVNNAKPRRSNMKPGNRQYLPWGVERIGAHLTQVGSAGVDADIFILDGGVMWTDLNEAGDVDIVATGSGSAMSAAHGTHVAGTAAAKDNSRGVVGVAPGARVHSYKVLNGSGNAKLSDVITAVDEITEMKLANPSRAMVVNISFGAEIGTTEYNSLDEAITNSIATGVTYVIAAGNEGVDASTVTPAHVEEAITVGAYDKSDAFAYFSNFGPTVDLLAPGVDIESLSASSRPFAPPALMSGTSMAAPHVAGAAALYLHSHPDASPDEVRAALMSAARPGIHGAPSNTTSLSVHTSGLMDARTTLFTGTPTSYLNLLDGTASETNRGRGRGRR